MGNKNEQKLNFHMSHNKTSCQGRLAQGKNGHFVNLCFKGTEFDSRLCQDLFKRDNINLQFKSLTMKSLKYVADISRNLQADIEASLS